MDFVYVCNSAVSIISIDFSYKSISYYLLQGMFWQITVYLISSHRLTIWLESLLLPDF